MFWRLIQGDLVLEIATVSVRRASSLEKPQKIEKDIFLVEKNGASFFQSQKNGESILLVEKNGEGIF